MFNKTFAAALFAASIVAAAPTATTFEERTPAQEAPKVTHTVVAGRNGLNFEPNNVKAEVGEVVEFHFLKVNHSVAQSSFAKPCVPDASIATPFFGGFNFLVPEGEKQAEKVFQITIKDTKPIWYYCPQTTGTHCQKGMVGVINRDYNNNVATIDAFKALAAKAPQSLVPAQVQGGNVIVNPNPRAGV